MKISILIETLYWLGQSVKFKSPHNLDCISTLQTLLLNYNQHFIYGIKMRINSNIHHNKKLYLPKNLRSFIVSNWKCSISPWRLNRWKVKLTRLFPKNKMKILIHWKPLNQWLFHKKCIISNKLVTKIIQANFSTSIYDKYLNLTAWQDSISYLL